MLLSPVRTCQATARDFLISRPSPRGPCGPWTSSLRNRRVPRLGLAGLASLAMAARSRSPKVARGASEAIEASGLSLEARAGIQQSTDFDSNQLWGLHCICDLCGFDNYSMKEAMDQDD